MYKFAWVEHCFTGLVLNERLARQLFALYWLLRPEKNKMSCYPNLTFNTSLRLLCLNDWDCWYLFALLLLVRTSACTPHHVTGLGKSRDCFEFSYNLLVEQIFSITVLEDNILENFWNFFVNYFQRSTSLKKVNKAEENLYQPVTCHFLCHLSL